MKVHFLGTGAGVPSKYRNTQSIVFDFMAELKECWMFDCGEATQHKLMWTPLKPSKITKIFISHFHGDHVLGLIGFLSSRSFLLSKEKIPLTIYGPEGIQKFVEFNMAITHTTLNYEISYVEYTLENPVILENSLVNVEIYPLRHTLQSYGFKIKFHNQKGALLVEKLKDLGIEPGPFYRQIKQQQTFTFNGVEYNSCDFLGEDKKGKEIALIPDTVYFEELTDFIETSDILITECTYLKEQEKELALNHKHINISDVYECDKKGNFDKIYLTHISSRYDKNDLDDISTKIADKITIVNDLEVYDL